MSYITVHCDMSRSYSDHFGDKSQKLQDYAWNFIFIFAFSPLFPVPSTSPQLIIGMYLVYQLKHHS